MTEQLWYLISEYCWFVLILFFLDGNCFSLSLSVVLFVIMRKNHRAEQWQRPFGRLLFKPPSQTGVNVSHQIIYLDKFCCGSSIQKPDELFQLPPCSASWKIGFLFSVNIFSGLQYMGGAFTIMHLVKHP